MKDLVFRVKSPYLGRFVRKVGIHYNASGRETLIFLGDTARLASSTLVFFVPKEHLLVVDIPFKSVLSRQDKSDSHLGVQWKYNGTWRDEILWRV